MKDITIYEVAAHAGVSIATVSRVLNSPLIVSSKTRQKVQEAIEILNFEPNADAAARARSEYKRIGVIAPFFTEPSFSLRLKGIAGALLDTDYELITYSVNSQKQLDGYLSMLPMSKRLDGLIILSLPIG
jgi:LacI family transcriptional regulator